MELYYDFPPETWPRDADGTLEMANERFSVTDFIAETEALYSSNS